VILGHVMYRVKKQGHLGLHAAIKVLRVCGGKQLRNFSFILFGVSGTCKTCLSCHSYLLGYPDKVIIRQYGIVIFRKDSVAIALGLGDGQLNC